MRRILQLLMAILMIAAIYCTFRYRVLPSGAEASKGKYVVVIDPGHGGEDPGKVGINDALEKEINLAIAKKLEAVLLEAGYEVVLTRTTDDGLYQSTDSNKKVADMKKRCQIIEEAKADIVVSIHQNSFSQESVRGAQVFYYKYSANGQVLADKIQTALRDRVDEENTRTIKDNSTYYMLVHTPCPTVIVECGFLSNRAEAEKLCTDEYQDKIANAIYEGIGEYFKE
ncbi:MAG: N-acetylmuramoyl-L-alanine amidase [Alistipes sp.]|nr:N-acetylmuramoyl-L-alanine amidase [Alistipes sp.]